MFGEIEFPVSAPTRGDRGDSLEVEETTALGAGKLLARKELAALALLSLLFAWPLAGRASAVTIAREGQPAAVIVMADKPSPAAREAASVLADHVFQISGARLEVLGEGKLGNVEIANGRINASPSGMWGNGDFVLLGQSHLARRIGVSIEGLGPGGIVIRTFPNALVLLGTDDATPSDPSGTLYAVTTFLEDALGVRYLWPGESGKVVPRMQTIAVSGLDIGFSPALGQRIIRWEDYYAPRHGPALERLGFTEEDFARARSEGSKTRATTPNWMKWHRMGGTLNVRMGDGTILPRETWLKFLEEHPEWFAMQLDGSRDQGPEKRPGGRPRLCKSNRELIEAIAREKIEELRRNPDQRSVSLCTHDGGAVGMCMCPDCKTLDPPEGRPTKNWSYDHATGRTVWFDYVSITDRMVHFYNSIAEKVAAEYPDVLFGGSAYSVYQAPPVRERLHPNIVIRFVGLGYYTDEHRRRGLADWDAWARAASRLYWRPGLLEWNRRKGTPLIYVHKLAEDFRHIAHNRCLGTDFDSCHHNWATNGLNYYVLAKLHWNPDLDVDALVEDYCRSGFGPGWRHVHRYLMRIEDLTDQVSAREWDKDKFDARDAGETDPYTPEVVAELRGYLDAAEADSGDDLAARRRIGFLRVGLDWADIQAQTYRFRDLARERKLTPEEWAEATKLLDRRWLMMRRIFQEEHFAVNVTTVTWGDWAWFRVLGWTGPSEETRRAASGQSRKPALETEDPDKVPEAAD